MILILCRVVDHFGDAGVCLRLARGLMNRGHSVALVADRRELVDRMLPGGCPGLRLLDWPHDDHWGPLVASLGPIDRVVEAFQVGVPQALLQALAAQHPPAQHYLLDYLATEPWADALQGLPAPDPQNPQLSRTWLAPSFSATGPGLVGGAWCLATPEERLAMRRQLLARAGHADLDPRSAFLVLGFGYPDAPWAEFSAALKAQGLPAGRSELVLWRPEGLELTQAEFDVALQATDLNIVRGEDSFVAAHRAAATPWAPLMIWMPYRQAETAHRHKLAGWAQQVLAHPALERLEQMQWAFNQLPPSDDESAPPELSRAWALLADDWDVVRGQFQRACRRLLSRPSLEESIVAGAGITTI